MSGADVILEIKGLKTHFFTRRGVVKAVDGVDFSLRRGEVMGLVGESGAGKSITGFSILRLIDEPGRIVDGEVIFEGRDLLTVPEAEMRRLRGDRLAMVFQDPQTSLDPVFTVGSQIVESLVFHQSLSPSQAGSRAAELLRAVGIPDAEKRLAAYPHQFSGGMRQRVVVAIAMAQNPALLVADEPTTALDVTIQAQVLTLMRRLVRNHGTAMILITHNMALVGQFCDSIAVMYAGQLIEHGTKEKVIRDPQHPYTQGLIRSIPGRQERCRRLDQIPGMMPNLIDLPPGCPFRPRCPSAGGDCVQRPLLRPVGLDHQAACWRKNRP